jgi:1-phosphofructokinase
MILCITPNPAIDRTLIVPGFRPGTLCRPTRTIVAAGGKGLNVARAVRVLGGEAVCAGLLGGHAGRLISELVEKEGLAGAWTWVEGESRTCIILVNPENGVVTEVCEQRSPILADDWFRLQADVLREATRADCVCLSGSLPPGCPPDAPAGLIRAIRAAGRPMWVDTSGTALRAALTAGPTGIKVNATEAGEILGEEMADVEAASRAAAKFQRMGVGSVVLTLGREGAMLATDAGTWWARPPALRTVSAVGSGDSFLAGLITALVAGEPPPQALRHAVAAGAANALNPGGAQFELRDFNAALEATSVSTTNPSIMLK